MNSRIVIGLFFFPLALAASLQKTTVLKRTQTRVIWRLARRGRQWKRVTMILT